MKFGIKDSKLALIDRIERVDVSTVTDGVTCYACTIVGTEERDLAVISIEPDHSTPIQLVEQEGTITIEGYVWGSGILTVSRNNGVIEKYTIKSEDYTQSGETPFSVLVEVGDKMQWVATDAGLVFYELCEPGYAEGRFRNLTLW